MELGLRLGGPPGFSIFDNKPIAKVAATKLDDLGLCMLQLDYLGKDIGAGVGDNNIIIETRRRSCEEELGADNKRRKKMRLTTQQSAFLEHTFKQHNTLNPKEKVCVATELNLSPRQVEVWFQNRRARTKLKQTEVDCEYLKMCSLKEENKVLQKEVQQLRALKSPAVPFQLPATTLTICPFCNGTS